jgi:hypothetical protein
VIHEPDDQFALRADRRVEGCVLEVPWLVCFGSMKRKSMSGYSLQRESSSLARFEKSHRVVIAVGAAGGLGF